MVLVYGDTNSTLGAALAAAKLHIPIAHVEAGLRSFNRKMPEEINRVLTDHLATLLYCPSEQAMANLAREGISQGVHMVGDVMADVLAWQRERIEPATALESFGVRRGNYALATIHRAENTDDSQRLRAIFTALEQLAQGGLPVLLPLHPRTRHALDRAELAPRGVQIVPPASYERMVALQTHARVILTDSGGVQKEAYWLGVPCVTLREETEWPETVAAGWNVLAGCDSDRIVAAATRPRPGGPRPALYGDGRAAERIVEHLLTWRPAG
jgi:UDP-N-acetylglucosamine 2-epimerase